MSVSLERLLAGDNGPAVNASFPTGNNGSDARDDTRATRKFQCGDMLRAARSLAIIYCEEMLVNVTCVVSRITVSKHTRHAIVSSHPCHHLAHLLRCGERGACRLLGRC